MKVKDLIQELQEKSEYKKFTKENPDTFFAAAFIIINLENKTEELQLDYFLPKLMKVAAFSHPFIKPKIHDDKIKNMQPQITKIKIDIDALGKTCNQIIKENNSGLSPTKIIAILRDNTWNLTCMDDALGIVRIKLDAISGKTQNFDKGSLMDFMGIKKK